jgi:hypothetical protein
MKFILKTSLLLAGALLALDVAAARAADFQDMTVTVPFPFVVHNRTMPAGKYFLQRDDADVSLLLIRNENGAHVASYVLTNSASGHDPSGDKPCLTFTRSGGQYRLSNVWESTDDGISVIAKK